MKRGALAAMALFVAVAFWINSARYEKRREARYESVAAKNAKGARSEADLKTLRSVAYLERYIEEVINKGSSQNLGFAYGDMPAGMADAKAAPKIAAYVVSLAGLKPSHPEWVKEGRLFYISNCGGCHGEDGRGIHGTFPDLTRVPMLGIKKRIEAALLAGGDS